MIRAALLPFAFAGLAYFAPATGADAPVAPAPRPKLATLVVRSVRPADEEVKDADGKDKKAQVVSYGLTPRDLELIGKLPGVAGTVPVRFIPSDVRRLAGQTPSRVVGTIPAFAEVSPLKIAAGRFLTGKDGEDRENVCVIGWEVADKLFPFDEDGPVGKTVTIRAQEFRVVGVLKEVGGAADRDIYIPLQTATVRLGPVVFQRKGGTVTRERVELHEIIVVASEPKELTEIADAVREALKKTHPKKDWEVVLP